MALVNEMDADIEAEYLARSRPPKLVLLKDTTFSTQVDQQPDTAKKDSPDSPPPEEQPQPQEDHQQEDEPTAANDGPSK